jgi:hypothetical protein
MKRIMCHIAEKMEKMTFGEKRVFRKSISIRWTYHNLIAERCPSSIEVFGYGVTRPPIHPMHVIDELSLNIY